MRRSILNNEMGRGLRLLVLAACLVVFSTDPARTSAEIFDLVARTWTSADGLCQNTINAIVQTPDGYLWIGTEAGLARFDGVQFKTFGLADGLRSLWIRAIVNDDHGGLWIATAGGGLSHWNGARIQTWTMEDGLHSNDLFSLHPAGRDSVWIGSSIGLQHCGPDGITSLEDLTSNGEEIEQATGIVRTIAGSDGSGIWFSVAYRGCFRLFKGRLEPVRFPKKISINHATSLYADRNGDVWAGMGNGIVLHRHGDNWIEYDESDGVPFSYTSCFAEGRSNELWLGSAEKGAFAFRDGRFEPVPGTANSVRSLCRDANGEMWVGAAGDGLTCLRQPLVGAYPVGSGTKFGAVMGLAETADGQIWAATWGGSLHHGSLDRLKPAEEPEDFGYYPAVRSCLCSTNGDLYVMGPQLLAVRSAHSEQWRTIFLQDDANLTSICELTDGTIVLGGRDGVLRRVSGDTIEACQGAALGSPILAVCAGADSQVWIATVGAGLHQWDAGNIKRWTTVEGLPSNSIQSLHLDGEGTLWIGTAGSGLAWLDAGGVQSLDSSRGLHSDSISAIVEDESGSLWLGSIRGIGRYSKTRLRAAASGRIAAIQPLVLDEFDGMPSAECSRGFSPAGLRLRSGRLLFSTHRHIIAIDPASIENKSPVPRVLIESVTIDDQRFQPQSWQGHDLSIGPGIDNISFEFTALFTNKPAQTQFRHRLVGLQSDWVHSGHRRLADYSAPPPGEYRFEVASAGPQSDWTVEPASLTFSVRPYYWQTWWFRLGVGFSLVCCGALGASIAQRARLLKARQQQQLAASELELRKRQDQLSHVTRVATLGEYSPSFAHELKQPLAAILSNAQAAKRMLQVGGADQDELAGAIDDIITDDRRASEMIGRIRRFQKPEAFDLELVNINDVVHESLRLVAAIMEQRSIRISISLAKDLPVISGDRLQLEQLVVNLLVNAAEAMDETEQRGRRLGVTTSNTKLNPEAHPAMVLVRIEDSGPGLSEDQIQKMFEPYQTTKKDGLGLGLSLCRSIVVLHGGNIWAEPSPNGSLIVCFGLPAARETP